MIGPILTWCAEMLQRGAHEVVAFAFGNVCFAAIWFFHIRKNHHNPPRIDQLQAEIDELKTQVDVSEESGESIQKELESQIDTLTKQIEGITEVDGEVWQSVPHEQSIPKFRVLEAGRAPIISILNLKGGVGKTTLTANLGATFFESGKKVLLVDLDYQGSLTSLCLDAPAKDHVRMANKFVCRLLAQETPTGEDILNLCHPIGSHSGCVVATDEQLTKTEMKVMAQWITKSTPDDVRYRLRSALHHETVQSRFDLIILDCPPRLSTACVNAITASDYVLIPVLLDRLSAEAVPRLLRWLYTLKNQNVCPRLNVMGVVGNRAKTLDGPSPKQQTIWNNLKSECEDTWMEPVHMFDNMIPDKVSFSDALENDTFAALRDQNLKVKFRNLHDEIVERFPAL